MVAIFLHAVVVAVLSLQGSCINALQGPSFLGNTTQRINNGIELSEWYAWQGDIRQAYVLVRHALGHPEATYHQRCRAVRTLALIMNCSRHVDILARTTSDIIRSDRELEEVARLVFYPHKLPDYRDISYRTHMAKAFETQNIDSDGMFLAHSQQALLNLTPPEAATVQQTYGLIYGRLGEFDPSTFHLRVCQGMGVPGVSHECEEIGRRSSQDLEEGADAVVRELHSRVMAAYTITAAKINFQTIYRLTYILSRHLKELSKNAISLAYSALWETRKYLYYHGWITASEAITALKMIHGRYIAEGDTFMIDTLTMARVDKQFGMWRRNGSEAAFWKNIRSKAINSNSNTTAMTPYVLRLVTNGMALHNFGHCQHDLLWPFIAAHNLHEAFSRQDAPIYVLEVGVFALDFLRLAYPHRQFISFRKVEEVPENATEVFISGLGAPKEFDINLLRSDELSEARKHMLGACGINETRNSKQILVVKRGLTSRLKYSVDERADRDQAEDHPALKHYYDSGLWTNSVITTKRIQGSKRRSIINLNYFISSLSALLPDEAKVVVFNPEEHTLCEQIRVFSESKVVIGQHGAGLSLIGYMYPGGGVIELESILNQIFKFIAQAAGLMYRSLEIESEVYATSDKHHITLTNIEIIARIAESMLQENQ